MGWQRGKRRRGAPRSVYPSTAPGKLGCVVRFNEKFDLPASLYKVTQATALQSCAASCCQRLCERRSIANFNCLQYYYIMYYTVPVYYYIMYYTVPVY